MDDVLEILNDILSELKDIKKEINEIKGAGWEKRSLTDIYDKLENISYDVDSINGNMD